MINKNMLIVGMAIIGALSLLTGTLVTIPTVLAYSDPEKTFTDPNQIPGWDQNGSPKQHCIGCIEYFAPGISDPNQLIIRR